MPSARTSGIGGGKAGEVETKSPSGAPLRMTEGKHDACAVHCTNGSALSGAGGRDRGEAQCVAGIAPCETEGGVEGLT